MKKALRETQTLRAGCSKAEPKFSPRRRPPSRGRGTAKIYSVGDGHYLYLQTQFGEDRCRKFRVIVVTELHTHNTHTHTDTHTQRQDRLQYTAPQLARSVKIRESVS